MTRARTLADLGSASLATDAELASEVATLNSTISGLALGKVLQVVRSVNGTSTPTTSTTYVDCMSISITPTLASSSLIVIANGVADTYYTTTLLQRGFLQITDASNTPLIGAQGSAYGGYEIGRISGSAAVQTHPFTLIGYSVPSTTSSVTYKLRHRAESGVTSTIRGGNSTTQMFVFEIAS